MAKLMEGVSEKVPMRSAVLGAFALFLQFLGYFSIAAHIYEHSKAVGTVMFFSLSFFIIIGTAHHTVKFYIQNSESFSSVPGNNGQSVSGVYLL